MGGARKIWVVGHRGTLGWEVTRVLGEAGMPFIATSSEHDITSRDGLRRFADSIRFDWIINCAAHTDVDGAERDPDRAFAVNATGAANLAAVAKEHGARLIHISTDYVFSGERGGYRVDDAPAPINVYGRSKLQGELQVAAQTAACFIVRTAWLYGRRGGGFVKTMLRLFHERDSVSVVDDQRGNPSHARDVAVGLKRIIERDSRDYGTFHVINRGQASRYELACAIYEGAGQRGLLERAVTLRPIPSTAYPTAAERPADTTLDGSRFEEVFELSLTDWRDALGRHLDLFTAEPECASAAESESESESESASASAAEMGPVFAAERGGGG